MENNYKFEIIYKAGQKFNVNFINKLCNENPNCKMLVVIPNTYGITSEDIKKLNLDVDIRVLGGYDEQRIDRFGKDIHWEHFYYINSVIYSKNEMIIILEQIEKIESKINPNWSEIQKLVYIYDRLKTGIMYDPKYEEKSSKEIRSLRGLITKQTVCAGYALILKEMLDRQKIECEYVEGYARNDHSKGHAWNIVVIDGKKYPVDLTRDNTLFRSGRTNSFEWLGQDSRKFALDHFPLSGEKTQNYEKTLSQTDPSLIKKIYYQINLSREYNSTTYCGKRSDGSRFIIAQIGNFNFKGIKYYRYYHQEVSKDGKLLLPMIFYSDTNVMNLVNLKKYGKPLLENYEKSIPDVLFSVQNITDSLAKKTFYLGKVEKSSDDEFLQLAMSVEEIEKPEEIRNQFVYPTKRFVRSDGTSFIVQQLINEPYYVHKEPIFIYDIFEIVKENGYYDLKKNTIFTEKNFFDDKSQIVIDKFLSRENIEMNALKNGGYFGYFDGSKSVYNPSLIKLFEPSKRQDIIPNKRDDFLNKFPTFEELKNLAINYEVVFDPSKPLESDLSKIQTREIKTNQIVLDEELNNQIIFANLWLNVAGIKQYQSDIRPGELYAFNEEAHMIYNKIIKEIVDQLVERNDIDPLVLCEKLKDKSLYKYNNQIIEYLFGLDYLGNISTQIILNLLGLKSEVERHI